MDDESLDVPLGDAESDGVVDALPDADTDADRVVDGDNDAERVLEVVGVTDANSNLRT